MAISVPNLHSPFEIGPNSIMVIICELTLRFESLICLVKSTLLGIELREPPTHKLLYISILTALYSERLPSAFVATKVAS